MYRIPIFLSSDNNYAPFVATTIASICDNTKSFCDFYILDGGIEEENKEKICQLKTLFNNFSIEFIQIDLEKEFKGFKDNMHFTKSMYSRFLIPILKPEIKKALYSDVDIIALGDIKEMYLENLEGYAIGAVWEAHNEKSVNAKKRKLYELSSLHIFFSSGNIIIDCNKWRENNILESLLFLEQKYRNILQMPDQDLLNIYFDNNYKQIDNTYCYLTHNALSYNNVPKEKIIIRHYEGLVKPWNVAEDSDIMLPNLKEWWYYAKKTSFITDFIINTKGEKMQSQMKRFFCIQKLLSTGVRR